MVQEIVTDPELLLSAFSTAMVVIGTLITAIAAIVYRGIYRELDNINQSIISLYDLHRDHLERHHTND